MAESVELQKLKTELQDCYTAMHTAISAADIYYFEYFPEENYALQYNGRENFGLEERLENYPDSWFARHITCVEDEPVLRSAFEEIKQGARKSSCQVRNLLNGQYGWFQYHFTSLYDEKGRRVKVVCTSQNISESKELEELNHDFRNLYTRTEGWVFTCRNDEQWTLWRTNPSIYEATGYTKEQFVEELNNEVARIVPERYRKMIREEIRRMKLEGYGSRMSCETPIVHRDGSYSWLKINLYWDRKGEKGFLYCTSLDITELKKSQEELRERNAMYELTTKHAHMNVWMYDIRRDVLYNTLSSVEMHVGEKEIPDFVNTAIERKMIRKDSIPDFLDLYEQLQNGVSSVTADIWMRQKNGSGWWCERITYVTVFDEEQRPYKAFGLGRDVTEFKEARRCMEVEREFQENADSEKLLLKTRCNLTTDQVETLSAKPHLHMPRPASTFTGGVGQMVENAYTKNDQKIVNKKLSIQYLEALALENGQSTFEYQRTNEKGHSAWTKVNVRVLYHPDTKNLIGFVNLYDINSERKLSAIINRISQVDYEVLALLYVQTDEMEAIRCKSEEEAEKIARFPSYTNGMHEFMKRYVIGEQIEEALQAFKLSRIRKGLEQNSTYEVSFTIREQKRLRQKTWKFTYFDETKDTIIYTRTDVTKIFKEQELQRETLKNALLQAEEASKAKTNFLSRMSHEIRTPMNAIIGMNALAIQVLDQPDQVRDYLSKVGISARFLLSLINDILDMSRIESGKVTLKNEKFPLEEFIHNINDIIYSQASQKGIDYDCVISGYTADYYSGDSMKLQQILVNLLGNSIKFTESGGKVQLIIRQERVEHNRAFMVFSVNDTGIGISPQLQKTMFEPFEQGNTTTTTPYKGTGLGLAIAKNLVTMMGGTITVNSIETVGSEFVVRVPLECCEDVKYQKMTLDLPLQQLKTLIVDDDVTICEHTWKLMEEIGMKAEWVESGIRAVEKIRMKWEKQEYFNIVLLDWKMPDMDGIETARQIRKIVGEEVTIIVMTAYDWSEIEQEAKMAGVNMLVTKPLFKSSLISVFESAIHTTHKKEVKTQIEHYDFSGKTVLLVEDHILNVEVARRLLETKHAKVEVAENGLRSIEMFMEAPDHYYDAILMDIRMPVMDGLTATRSIRQLRRQSAKTIPIIAMSANAFDEDVEKSREAGMNEHLSKPIEPQVLYAVLQQWLHVTKPAGQRESMKNATVGEEQE